MTVGSVLLTRADLEAVRIWGTKFEMRTPRPTTQVGALPIAVAG
ncbi:MULTISPECIES: hypothetical protein [unclassified Methylobacterium]|jgi:DNA polymerase V|nr:MULTISPECIES: hypothetical protein [unclassified Methylobacterium]